VRLPLHQLLLLIALASCRPTTTRPPFTPFPEAAATEIRLSVPDATRRLAEALRADSIPLRKVIPQDGYLESVWFNARNRRPFRSRPIGPQVVRIRAWADPARPGSSLLTVETSYRPVADPSLSERELEREVTADHPVAARVTAILRKMVERFGGPPPPAAADAARPTTGAE
jgi:hypothetical protein